jgi:transcriptional regulator with XRE-family HTH domain
MKTRILEFIKNENKSAAQLAEEIGVQPSSISHIISGRNNPSLDFVMKMLSKYPALSTDWLLFGKGDMYREPQLTDLFEPVSGNNSKEQGITGEYQKRNIQGFMDNFSDKKQDIPSVKSGHSINNKTIRIVCFFADNTFKEYFSVDEIIS